MARKKKEGASDVRSGRLMLRMDPDIHARVAQTAKTLGMDMTGLLNLLIRTHLPRFEMQAELTKKAILKYGPESKGILVPVGNVSLGDIYRRLKELTTELGEMSDAIFEGLHDQLMDKREPSPQERSKP